MATFVFAVTEAGWDIQKDFELCHGKFIASIFSFVLRRISIQLLHVGIDAFNQLL